MQHLESPKLKQVAVLAGAAFLVLLAWWPPSAHGALCHTQAQSITKRHNISCKAARRVATYGRAATSPDVPECNGEPVEYWHGWRLSPNPIGGTGIGTKFEKGTKSFVLSGGGVC